LEEEETVITDTDIAINEMINKEGFSVCIECPFYQETIQLRTGHIGDICWQGYVAPSDCARARKIILGTEEIEMLAEYTEAAELNRALAEEHMEAFREAIEAVRLLEEA